MHDLCEVEVFVSGVFECWLNAIFCNEQFKT